jgi:transcriptional regulator
VYIPKAFEENRQDVLHAFIQQYSFGIVVSQGTEGIIATHLPLLLEPEWGPLGTLSGHVARANPHWRSMESGEELLAIFQGPHAYISPSWYEARLSVPTWNYVAVHAYGRPRLIEDATSLRGLLERLVVTHEASFDRPWPFDLPQDYVEQMMRAIVGFEIEITRLEGKYKLGQNRTSTDQAGAIAGLLEQGDPVGLEVARLMQAAASPDPLTPAATASKTDTTAKQ